jgi:multidrug transporter EmrE-like cation transporter
MGVVDILALATVEVYGDFNLRWFAQSNSLHYLWRGIAGYIGVVYLLTRSLRSNNVLYVNGLWDGFSSIVESLAAYYYLGDRLKSTQQYVGLIMTVAGVALMKME